MEKYRFCFKNSGTHQNIFGFVLKFLENKEKFRFCFKNSCTHQNVLVLFQSF